MVLCRLVNNFPFGYCTTCVTVGDVLAPKLVFPSYSAVILCEPFFRAEVPKLACPAFSVTVASVLPASLKVTVPVGVPPDADVTCAVNVTATPTADGLSEELSVVVVAIFCTVCLSAPEMLFKKVPSPPYTALMLCAPVASEDVVNVACPDAFSARVRKACVPVHKRHGSCGHTAGSRDRSR